MRDFRENKRENAVIDLGIITVNEMEELDERYNALIHKVLTFEPQPDYKIVKFEDGHVELHCFNGFSGLLRFA